MPSLIELKARKQLAQLWIILFRVRARFTFRSQLQKARIGRGTAFLRREALAAPEDVGGEDGERDHEGDPDAVGTR